MDVVNHQINKKLRFGYDVGTGYVMGEEEVHKFIDLMIDNTKIAKEMKHKMSTARLRIIRELGKTLAFNTPLNLIIILD